MTSQRGFVPRFMHAWRDRLAPLAGKRIGIGVSGGMDSAVLAVLLARLRAALNIRRIVLLHLDHGLRPPAERAADLRVLRRLSRRLRAPLVSARVRIRASSAGIEAAGRAARLKFFAQAVRRRRLDSVALAHHLDDRIETFFLFLCRGSGSRGLSSMRVSEQLGGLTVIRPLLTFTRSEIRAFADLERVEFHEDITNTDRRFFRNRIRHDLIPLLTSWQPGFLRAMSATLDALESEDAVLADLSGEIFRRCVVSRARRWIILDRARLRGWPPGLLARVLQRAEMELGGSGTFGGHENLSSASAALSRSTPFSLDLPGGMTLRMSRDRIELRLPAARAD